MKKIKFIILIVIIFSVTLGQAVMSSDYGSVSRAAAPKPERVIAGWQLFRNDTYGFQIQHPADWKLEEVEILEPEDDLPLKYVLLFRPQDWQGIVAPVTVEVGVGSLDELRRVWAILDIDRSNSIINGYEVLVGSGMYDVVSRVFVHPTNKELLIAVRDNVGSTRQDSTYLSEIVQRMLSTFRFN
jgi:hypothetical protein